MTYLLTAARDVIDEPPIYGPLRMLFAVDLLVNASLDDDFLKEFQPQLAQIAPKALAGGEVFVAWLDDLTARFAAEAKRRNLLEEPAR